MPLYYIKLGVRGLPVWWYTPRKSDNFRKTARNASLSPHLRNKTWDPNIKISEPNFKLAHN